MGVDSPPTLPLLLLWALGSSSDSGSAGYHLSLRTSRQHNSLLATFGYYVYCITLQLHIALLFREK